VVGIGAGFDTTYLRLKENPDSATPFGYFEVDFEKVVLRKRDLLASPDEPMGGVMGEIFGSLEEGGFYSADGVYRLLPGDLRQPETVGAALLGAGLDPRMPTIFLSECVLVYLERQHAHGLLEWISTTMDTAGFALYEQIHPNDPFGQMMIKNLETRGCPLLGLEATPDLVAQRERYLGAGWSASGALDMNDVYRCLPIEDRVRVERLEHLDEVEEHIMFQGHYCVSWAAIHKAQGASESLFCRTWGLVPEAAAPPKRWVPPTVSPGLLAACGPTAAAPRQTGPTLPNAD